MPSPPPPCLPSSLLPQPWPLSPHPQPPTPLPAHRPAPHPHEGLPCAPAPSGTDGHRQRWPVPQWNRSARISRLSTCSVGMWATHRVAVRALFLACGGSGVGCGRRRGGARSKHRPRPGGGEALGRRAVMLENQLPGRGEAPGGCHGNRDEHPPRRSGSVSPCRGPASPSPGVGGPPWRSLSVPACEMGDRLPLSS